MSRKKRANLDSPTGIQAPCNLSNIYEWVIDEANKIPQTKIRDIIVEICLNVDEFVRWPKRSLLLIDGCDRSISDGMKSKYHKYPKIILEMARQSGFKPDGRANGPAVAAFLLAGGERPMRYGSNNSWSIHHIYSGKFPYLGNKSTIHAVRDGRHFTQSAGLIAIHPIADQICDEFAFFSWFMRAHSYLKFGYDPDRVFSTVDVSDYGFLIHSQPQIISKE